MADLFLVFLVLAPILINPAIWISITLVLLFILGFFIVKRPKEGINNQKKVKSIILGLIYSFLVFVIIYSFFALYQFVLLIASAPGGSLDSFIFYIGNILVWSYQNKIPSIIVGLLFSTPFLFFNSIALFLSKDKNRKIGLMIGYIFAIIVFISAFMLYSNYAQSLDQEKINAAGIKQNDLSVCAEENFSAYGELGKEVQIALCFKKIAMQKNDTSICDKIVNPSDGSWPYKENCYTGIAIQSNNSSYCEKISDTSKKDVCFYILAQTMRNTSLCDKVDFSHFSEDGLSKTDNGSSYLGGSKSYRKDTCYYYSVPLDVGINPENIKLYEKWCPIFESNFYKEKCDNALETTSKK